MYVELHSCSAFSFLEGASLPEDLVSEAARLELPAIALLDRDGVYGSPRFHMAAKKAGGRGNLRGRVRNSSRHAVLDAKQDSFETGPAGSACQEPHRIPEPLSSDDPLQAAGKGKRDRGRDAGRSRGTRQGAGLPHRR